jgi:hypothetical protein
VVETAAVMYRFFAAGCLRNSWRNPRKFSESELEISLQPMPGLFGYSQLKGNVRNEWRGNAREDGFSSLEVNPVKGVFGGHVKDCLDERGTVLRSYRGGEMSGTSPSTDGDASHHSVLLSLLDEIWNVADPRVVKAEDRWIRGGDPKNVYGRLAYGVERTMDKGDIRKGPGDETVLLPVDAGQRESTSSPSSEPGRCHEIG